MAPVRGLPSSACVALAAGALSISAATSTTVVPPQDAQATFRRETRTVAVHATVRDRDGRLVPNLTRDDFEILDDGKPAPITTFSNDLLPFTAVLLLDMSNSMVPHYFRVVAAAGHFINNLMPADRLRIGTLGREVALSPWLTSDRILLTRVLNEEVWPSGGGTPLWRASKAAMDSLAGEQGRRVILMLTDGLDSGHEYNCTPLGTGPLAPSGPCATRAGVGKQAETEAFMFYAIGLEGRGLDPGFTGIVRDTGGGYFRLSRDADLMSTFGRVADELHHQYVLGFSPTVLDGKTHRLDIRLARPGLTARARKSYVAEAR
jgi:Ca-activated chloride channel family protein